jgi:hypothetical protein
MCFSAEASLTAGMLLIGIGAASVVQAPDRRSLPFAAIPLLFGFQQIAEGGVWLSLAAPDEALQGCFATGYSLLALVLWPVFVPIAVYLIEPAGRRRDLIAACAVIGILLAAVLLGGMITLPVGAAIQGAHIHYSSQHFDMLFNAGLFVPAACAYVAATCLSLLLSGDRWINAIGATMAAAFAVSYLFYENWLVSVWCFFAAILSVLILTWAKRRGEALGLTPPVRTS